MNTSNIKIEKDKTIPERSQWAALIKRMKKGDSVVIPIKYGPTFASTAHRIKVKLTRRTETKGNCRYWRLS